MTSHCSISAMMTVDCSHCAPTTLCNVWLSTSGTSEVAKHWTTAFSKVGTSQRCGSCSQQQTNHKSNTGFKLLCNEEGTLTHFHKSTLPAHHQCCCLVPPTVTHSPPEPLHTDLHSSLTLPLSTNKTKISRAALWLGGSVPLTDNTYHRIIIPVVTIGTTTIQAGRWWWQCCWTLFQWTLNSSAPHRVGEYGSSATSKERSSQRNRPCMVDLKISHHKAWLYM